MHQVDTNTGWFGLTETTSPYMQILDFKYCEYMKSTIINQIAHK